MSFFLVCPELDFTLELQLSPAADLQLQRQIERVQECGDGTRFEIRLADQLCRVLPEAVDWDIKEPTKAQIALAQSLCRQLGIPLNRSAMTSRYEMHQFIALMSKSKLREAELPRAATVPRARKKRPARKE